MRSLASLLLVALIALGAYFYLLKRAAPGAGMVATQAISTTGVEMDLTAIAQAERTYFAQNGSYASLGELTSSGALTMARTGRDSYEYSIETSAGGFTVTARHQGASAALANGAAPPHYPALSIDQTMQVRQSD
jgi:hypothetical protein